LFPQFVIQFSANFKTNSFWNNIDDETSFACSTGQNKYLLTERSFKWYTWILDKYVLGPGTLAKNNIL